MRGLPSWRRCFVSKWEMVRLDEIGSIITGSTPKSEDYRNFESKDIPFIKPSDFVEGSISQFTEPEFYLSEYSRSKIRVLPQKSVLVTCIGIIGKVGIAERELTCNQQINAIIPHHEICDERYLAYAISLNQKRLQNVANAAVVPIINKTEFSKLKIPLPPLEVQRKIADALDLASSLIEKRKAQIEKLDLLIQAIFSRVNQKTIKEGHLSEYIEVLTAGKSLAGDIESNNKVLCTGSVSYDRFDATQVKNLPISYSPDEKHLVRDEDILISRMNTIELVGASAYVWAVDDNVYLPDRIWRAELRDNVDPIFLWQLLVQKSTKNAIRDICGGTSGSMKNISKSRFLDILVPIVSLETQREISANIRKIQKQKNKLSISLSQLEQNYQSLLQKCFRGEIFS